MIPPVPRSAETSILVFPVVFPDGTVGYTTQMIRRPPVNHCITQTAHMYGPDIDVRTDDLLHAMQFELPAENGRKALYERQCSMTSGSCKPSRADAFLSV